MNESKSHFNSREMSDWSQVNSLTPTLVFIFIVDMNYSAFARHIRHVNATHTNFSTLRASCFTPSIKVTHQPSMKAVPGVGAVLCPCHPTPGPCLGAPAGKGKDTANPAGRSQMGNASSTKLYLASTIHEQRGLLVDRGSTMPHSGASRKPVLVTAQDQRCEPAPLQLYVLVTHKHRPGVHHRAPEAWHSSCHPTLQRPELRTPQLHHSWAAADGSPEHLLRHRMMARLDLLSFSRRATAVQPHY